MRGRDGEPYCASLIKAEKDGTFGDEDVRIVIDMIAGMTESQAFRLHQRLYGISPGSIHDRMT